MSNNQNTTAFKPEEELAMILQAKTGLVIACLPKMIADTVSALVSLSISVGLTIIVTNLPTDLFPLLWMLATLFGAAGLLYAYRICSTYESIEHVTEGTRMSAEKLLQQFSPKKNSSPKFPMRNDSE